MRYLAASLILLAIWLRSAVSAPLPPPPAYAALQQRPLSVPLPKSRTNDPHFWDEYRRHASVGILVTLSKEAYPRYVQIPLGHQISPNSFPGLPLRPRAARIVTISNPENLDIAPTTKMLSHVVCVIHPVISPAERNTREYLSRSRHVQDGWSLRLRYDDSQVDFEDPDDKFFLAGRAIETIECY